MLLYQILALSSLILACTHGKNIKTSHKNNKFKISAPTWNDKFELLDERYSLWGIQDNFEHIIKKHDTLIDNPPIRIYVNDIENRIILKN